MKENGVRNRFKNGNQNGVVDHEGEKKDEEFSIRESPLTELLDKSLHIRAIYHIFVVILLVLFCDTVIFDLIESGKQVNVININYYAKNNVELVLPLSRKTSLTLDCQAYAPKKFGHTQFV